MIPSPEYQWKLDVITCLQKIEEEIYARATPDRMLKTREEIKRLIDEGIDQITKSKEAI